MRRYILSLIALFFCMSIGAQVIKVYKIGETTPIATYTNTETEKYKVVFEERVEPKFLPGNFTVSATKTVQFTKSNIYWNGSIFRFEENQTDCPTEWNPKHIGHFYWTKTAAASYALKYDDDEPSTISDEPFFAESRGGFRVQGSSHLYALSKQEWVYLMNDRIYTNRFALAMVNGVKGLLIFPDSYNGFTPVTGTGIATVNVDDAPFPSESIPSDTWTAMESDGVVFLPAAGYRDDSTIRERTSVGYCWASTSDDEEEFPGAYNLEFESRDVSPWSGSTRNVGYSLRLVKTNSEAIVPVTSISLNKTSTSIEPGKDETLTVIFTPENAYNKNVTWTTSNANVATVDATGKVSIPSTATVGATATITATTQDGNKTATCTVTVIKYVASVSLNTVKSSREIPQGTEVTLTPIISPSDATNKNVTWSSSNTSVATIDATGKISIPSTVAVGSTATITVTTEDGNKTATCNVTVIDKNLLPGNFTIAFDGYHNKTVKFTKSNIYWDGSDYKFEPTQTGFGGGFFWTSIDDYHTDEYKYMPYADEFKHKNEYSTSDRFWCGENDKMRVEGTRELYVMSSAEWYHLINNRTNASSLHKCGVTVDGHSNCLIIAPDGYTNAIKPLSETTEYTLKEINDYGLVCLPAAGQRGNQSNEVGRYWSSTTYTQEDLPDHYCNYLGFGSNVFISVTSRSFPYSIRLVK